MPQILIFNKIKTYPDSDVAISDTNLCIQNSDLGTQMGTAILSISKYSVVTAEFMIISYIKLTRAAKMYRYGG